MSKVALKRSVAAACVLALLAGHAYAQTDAGSLLNQQQRQKQNLPDRLPEAERASVPQALTPTLGARITLVSVRFTGSTDLATEAELQGVVAKYVGQQLDFKGLEELPRAVTQFLRSKGWLLAEARLLKQDVTEGRIEINIRAGKLDGSIQKNGGTPYAIHPSGQEPLRIRPDVLDAYAGSRLVAGAPVHESELERAMLLLNDLPGISARSLLEPGKDADSTHVDIAVDEGGLFSGSFWADNEGNRDTGFEQANTALQWSDPLRVGDQASVSATHTEGLDLVRLGYGAPINSNGLKWGVSWTEMNYHIIRGTGLAAGLTGKSDSSAINLNYPLIRSRASSLYGSASFTRKSLVDDSIAGQLRDKCIDDWSAGLSSETLDGFGGGGRTSWSVAATQGHVDLSHNTADQASDAATYGSQGTFTKFSYGLSRQQQLPQNFTLYVNLAGQSASKNLDSSEKFILGGPGGVRAYPGSEASGDSGVLGNLELRYEPAGGTPWGVLQYFGFFDTGAITLHHDVDGIAIPTASGQNTYTLSGGGLGVSLSKPGRYNVRFVWARKMGSNPGRSVTGLDADSLNTPSRVWLQANVWF
jgi:hemolysin activation/secretion protein